MIVFEIVVRLGVLIEDESIFKKIEKRRECVCVCLHVECMCIWRCVMSVCVFGVLWGVYLGISCVCCRVFGDYVWVVY